MMPNMTPEMMETAMKQMQNMSPDQLAQMQQSVANMDPAMLARMGYSPADLQRAKAQMAGMTADDMARMSEEMRRMSPEQLQQQLQGAQGQMQAQADYKYKASLTLKSDGNGAVAAGRFAEAAEKYVRARENLADHQGKEALELKLACTLNLALCKLKLDDNRGAEELCTEALGIDRRSYKAYYRRALARKELGDRVRAAADLKKALEINPNDSTIQQTLQAVKDVLQEEGNTDIEDIQPSSEESVIPSTGVATSGMDMAAAAKAMKENPDVMKHAAAAVKNMSPEDLASMSKMAPGGMEMSPEMVKSAADMMANMSPDQMTNMMKMAESMKGATAGPSGLAPGEMPDSAQMAEIQKEMAKPENRKMMADMMKNITPEQMQQMSQRMGMNLSEEEASKMSEQMQNMDEKSLERLMAVSAYAQAAIDKAKQAKEFFFSRRGMLLSLIVLVLAIVYAVVLNK
mmetsp:Transcript_13161/g.47995  ORF Transcript_13161/g.47995 Transcript_13161/m.47995 type:complete len:460 (-) Transcript_13161:2241-3620(-)